MYYFFNIFNKRKNKPKKFFKKYEQNLYDLNLYKYEK